MATPVVEISPDLIRALQENDGDLQGNAQAGTFVERVLADVSRMNLVARGASALPIFERDEMTDIVRRMELFANRQANYNFLNGKEIADDAKIRLSAWLADADELTIEQFLKPRDKMQRQVQWDILRTTVHNSYRTISRRRGRSISLEQITQEAADERTPEEIATFMKSKGNGLGRQFAPRLLDESPIGKPESFTHNFIDADNSKVDPLIRGLGSLWWRMFYVASHPSFHPKKMESYRDLAAANYRNDVNFIVAAESSVYPNGGPLGEKQKVAEANDAKYRVRWRVPGSLMIPFLGDGKKGRKNVTFENDTEAQELHSIAEKVMARSYLGRLVTSPDEKSCPERLRKISAAHKALREVEKSKKRNTKEIEKKLKSLKAAKKFICASCKKWSDVPIRLMSGESMTWNQIPKAVRDTIHTEMTIALFSAKGFYLRERKIPKAGPVSAPIYEAGQMVNKCEVCDTYHPVGNLHEAFIEDHAEFVMLCDKHFKQFTILPEIFARN